MCCGRTTNIMNGILGRISVRRRGRLMKVDSHDVLQENNYDMQVCVLSIVFLGLSVRRRAG